MFFSIVLKFLRRILSRKTLVEIKRNTFVPSSLSRHNNFEMVCWKSFSRWHIHLTYTKKLPSACENVIFIPPRLGNLIWYQLTITALGRTLCSANAFYSQSKEYAKLLQYWIGIHLAMQTEDNALHQLLYPLPIPVTLIGRERGKYWIKQCWRLLTADGYCWCNGKLDE